VAIKFFLMLLIPIGLYVMLSSFRGQPRPHPSADVDVLNDTEITVEPNSSWWLIQQEDEPGTLVLRVEARNLDLGINLVPLRGTKVSDPEEEQIHKSKVNLKAGEVKEVAVRVLKDRSYAVMVGNGAETPAQAHVTLTWKK
jgi:hypothetical protein